MSVRILVTDHARRRWRQRGMRRLGIEDVDALARSAWQRGAKTKRSLRNVRGVRRIYMGYTFVFDPGADVVALLTILPPRHG